MLFSQNQVEIKLFLECSRIKINYENFRIMTTLIKEFTENKNKIQFRIRKEEENSNCINRVQLNDVYIYKYNNRCCFQNFSTFITKTNPQ